jgi:two-component system response regulator HydG
MVRACENANGPLNVVWISDEVDEDPITEAFGPGLARLGEQVRRVASQETTVLLAGETGTGKTRLARYLHEQSRRQDGPFLVIDCGALSPSLIESEMFGHVRGAFTGADRDRPGKFAAAARGTVFLDELNSLPLTLQSRLLRVVDERVFEPVGSNRPVPLEARLIAATNARLDREVEVGRFRSDLYYRLNVVEFFLPPLRERGQVVPRLTRRFLAEFVKRNRPDIRGIAADALGLIASYDWPGNLRELRNVLERAVALAPGPVVQAADLPEPVRQGRWEMPRETSAGRSPQLSATLASAKEDAEVARIREALEKHDNNRARAAAELGISRMGLYKKLKRYRLP